MLETIIEWLAPNSLFQIITLAILAFAVFKGRIKTVGKGGVEFYDRRVTDGHMTKLEEQVSKLAEQLSQFGEHLEKMEEMANKRDLNILKLQIQVAQSLELKQILYDEYKARGGNSWIDDYIKKCKEQV